MEIIIDPFLRKPHSKYIAQFWVGFCGFKQGILNKYMCYLFNTNSFLDVLKLISKGTTNVSAIYYKDLSNLEVIVPSTQEQQQIVEHLDKETTKIDSTIEKETQRIELLKEYRQSLISEVVTGKVDVREEVN